MGAGKQGEAKRLVKQKAFLCRVRVNLKASELVGCLNGRSRWGEIWRVNGRSSIFNLLFRTLKISGKAGFRLCLSFYQYRYQLKSANNTENLLTLYFMQLSMLGKYKSYRPNRPDRPTTPRR